MTATTSVSSTGTLTDRIKSTLKWTSPALTYSFPVDVSNYGGGSWGGGTFKELSTTYKNIIRSIYPEIARFSGLTFSEITEVNGVDSNSTSTLRHALSNTAPQGFAGTLSPSSAAGAGDTDYDSDFEGGYFTNPAIGHYGFHTAVHEIGHGLNFKHTFEDQSGSGGFAAMPSAQDARYFSVMSYSDYGGGGVTTLAETYGGPWFYSPFDILALQDMYGVGAGYAGNTTYKPNATTGVLTITDSIEGVFTYTPGANRILHTLTLGATGTKTLDATDYSSGTHTFDLRPFSASNPTYGGCILSSTQTVTLGGGHSAPWNLNVGGTSGWLMTDVLCGPVDTTVYANAAANLFTGNASKTNTLILSGNNANYTRHKNGTNDWTLTDTVGSDSTTRIINFTTVTFANGSVPVSGFDAVTIGHLGFRGKSL